MSQDRSWDLPEGQATDRKWFAQRRRLVGALGLGGLAVSAAGGAVWWYRGTDDAILLAGRESAGSNSAGPGWKEQVSNSSQWPVDRPITDQAQVARYVNYYEFSPQKIGTWRKAQVLPLRPWTLTVDGLVDRPTTFDIDELTSKFGQEQRVYRHRCVEAWAMVVPWLGFPLRTLLDAVGVKAEARFVRFETADIERLTGVVPPLGFTWPYQEALTLAEATNELAFLATGYYGEPLFRQNGAPLRLVVPWKYGFKSAKSLVRIELTARQPDTFWNVATPHEYGFYANVNPAVDHPRWSQARERMIDTGEIFPTQLYNGYQQWVAHLYTGNEV